MKKNIALSTTVMAFGVVSSVSSRDAEAIIIHQEINQGTSLYSPLALDVNADGIDDLSLTQTISSGYNYYYGDLWVSGLNGTGITLGGPLAFGDLIDNSLAFGSSNHLADYNSYRYYYSCGYRGRYTCSSGSSSTTGSWNSGYNSITGYLGFVMSVANEDLFGWAHLSMNYAGSATIHELAYETTPFTSLTAGQIFSDIQEQFTPEAATVPEPSSLALLALGAAGVAGIRRRRKVA